MLRFFALILLSVAALGCGEPALQTGERESTPTYALAGIPMPLSSGAVSTSGTGSSVEITLVDTMPPDSIAEFYRRSLLTGGWDLRVDGPLPNGGITLHAVRGERPVWIMIYPREPSGSRFSVIAGVRDTTTGQQ